MTIILYSHTDASGVLLSSGWKLAIYRKKTTANYLLFQNWEETLCCVVMASTCFLLVSEWKWLQSSKSFIMFPNGALLWECLLCAVTCYRILCMESVQASIKTRNWYPVIKGYVVVFQSHTTVMLFRSRRVNVFLWAHCWLELLTRW